MRGWCSAAPCRSRGEKWGGMGVGLARGGGGNGGGGLVIAWGSRGRRGPVWEEGGGRMGHAEDVCQPWGETKRAGPKVIVESSYLFKKFQKT
jgi:hypothetical protein